MSILTEAELWVALGMAVFFGILIYAKVPGMAMKALDDHGARVKAELDEALRLRQEAQALLEGIRHEREAAEKLAAEILAAAEDDARRLRADAEVRLADQIERRRALAERRIANAEQQAALEVKAAAAEAAAALAAAVLADRLAGMSSDPQIDRAVAEIGVRLR
ncbi:MAG TPA: ATP F0F1 synthase subunit B [Caulobacteraceae bacterium]|nr:ATP F0F1 synthase subunit B [Caulobacteraceae bacterium]